MRRGGAAIGMDVEERKEEKRGEEKAREWSRVEKRNKERSDIDGE